MRPLIIIDVDGTVTDFKRIDNEIILDMYQKNKLVMLLDKVLWKINSLDYFTNKFWVFKLRIFMYSIFSLSGYKFNMIKYQKKYVQKTREDFKMFFEVLHPMIRDMGYETLLLSHDRFANNVDENIVWVKDKKNYVLNSVYSSYDVIYIVGNNYTDDIKLGLKVCELNLKLNENMQTNVVYIGKSKYLINKVLKNSAVKCKSSFEEFIVELKNSKNIIE